ncbi:MAG: hypothetical protein F6K42_33010 [Leptolyngbya sp. SIO1D8]|nr:hypothetical protein [Leptolyngbya sp. SIO1D8]
MRVIPIILRSCLWQQVPVSDMRLGDLQALPKDAKPISQWADRDETFTSIAEARRQQEKPNVKGNRPSITTAS